MKRIMDAFGTYEKSKNQKSKRKVASSSPQSCHTGSSSSRHTRTQKCEVLSGGGRVASRADNANPAQKSPQIKEVCSAL